MSSKQAIELVAQIELADSDAEMLDQTTRQLRDELQELGVDSVELVSAGRAQPGTKAFDVALVGTLAIAVGPLVLTKLLEFLHSWAMRREGCAVKLKVQTKAGTSLEIEAPATMAQAEVKSWISMVSEALATENSKK